MHAPLDNTLQPEPPHVRAISVSSIAAKFMTVDFTMQDPENSDNNQMPYRVTRIEKTDSPDENSTGEWYSYRIEHLTTTINGKCAGNFQQVKQHLNEYVEKLNARAILGYSPYAARPNRK